MSLTTVKLDDAWVSQSIDQLREEHSNTYATLRRSQVVASRILELAWPRTGIVNPVPWIVLRGGLVFWMALHDQKRGPIGMVLPKREDRGVSTTCCSPSVSEPQTPVILDWVISSGRTMEATINEVSQVSGSDRLVIVSAASAVEGEQRLASIPDLELELFCGCPGMKPAGGLLLGFDMGDCTAAMPLQSVEG